MKESICRSYDHSITPYTTTKNDAEMHQILGSEARVVPLQLKLDPDFQKTWDFLSDDTKRTILSTHAQPPNYHGSYFPGQGRIGNP